MTYPQTPSIEVKPMSDDAITFKGPNIYKRKTL